MQCKNCGTVIPENGVFCPTCGIRCDGKKVCPSCKNTVDESTVFCTYCGARVDGKKRCASCGEYYEGNFCYKCGSVGTVEKEDGKGKKAKTKIYGGFAKVEKIISPALVLGALFVIFVCSFFIGTITKIGPIVQTETNSFYFFKDIYENIKTIIENYTSDGSSIGFFLYFASGSITILIVANMVLPLIFLIVGGVKYYQSYKTGERANLEKYAIVCFAIFTVTACFVYGINGMAVELLRLASVVATGISSSVTITASGGSIVGIALGGIILVSSIVMKLIANGEFSQPKKIASKILSFGAVVLTLVLIFTLNSSFCAVNITLDEVKETLSVSPITSLIYSFTMSEYSGIFLDYIKESILPVSVCSFVLYLIIFAMLCLTLIFAFKSLDNYGAGAIFCSAIVVFVNLVMMIASSIFAFNMNELLFEFYSEGVSIVISTVLPFILSLILLACLIASQMVKKGSVATY